MVNGHGRCLLVDGHGGYSSVERAGLAKAAQSSPNKAIKHAPKRSLVESQPPSDRAPQAA